MRTESSGFSENLLSKLKICFAYNDLSDIICDKDLAVKSRILTVKLEEADKENTFLRREVENFTVLSNAKTQTSSHNFKPNTK